MTPLTHAAVGTAIYQMLGSRFRRWGWALAFLLAFLSHFVLDFIPHFEDVGPLESDSLGKFPTFLGLGLIGVAFALVLRRWNQEATLIWLILSLWIGLGSYSYPRLRILTAALGLGYLAWRSKQARALGYLAGGMLAVAADLVPLPFDSIAQLHNAIHYQVGWGERLYLRFAQTPLPLDWQGRAQNPYFLLGYGIELLSEGLIFFGALYLFSCERFAWRKAEAVQDKIREPLELIEKS